jgi:hypothetical protein
LRSTPERPAPSADGGGGVDVLARMRCGVGVGMLARMALRRGHARADGAAA